MAKGKRMEMSGKWGMLTIIKAAPNKGAHVAWLCRCDCGKETVVSGAQLRKGTRSCGCIRGKDIKHGMSRTLVYRVWGGMIDRCENPNLKTWPDYGGRGIKVCVRWRESFENFYADMGDRPSPLYTLDRIDNDGNYEPGNVRWATIQQQNRNTRGNRRITHNGETLSVTEWAERIGIKRGILFNRLLNGWSVEKALTTPVRRYHGRAQTEDV